MSFVNNREKVFKSRSQCRLAVKRAKAIRMRPTSAFNDPRAWSLDPRKRTAYIFDSIKDMPSSSGGEDTTKETSQSELDDDEYTIHKKIIIDKGSRSADDILKDEDVEVLKLNNNLISANEEIEKLKTLNEALAGEKAKTKAEIDNLRTLVANMSEQMQFLTNLRKENHFDDSVDRDEELEKAQQQINHLSRQVEIYADMRTKYSELRSFQEKLLREKNELSRAVEELKLEKRHLFEKLKTKEQDIADLEIQSKSFNEGIKEKMILRERVAIKEEKIRNLSEIVENQNVKLEKLDGHLISLNRSFEEKEQSLNWEIEGLRAALNEKTAIISRLEAKLHKTEMLVAELEMIRDQFRSNNLVLTDSIGSYRKELNEMMKSSEAMTISMKQLQAENEAKERELQKLTIFPQNPETMLYFAHMNKLVTSAPDPMTGDQQLELLENLKSLIVKLKEGMWGTNLTPLEIEIRDFESQTEFGGREQCVQCAPLMTSTFVQTLLPNDYLEMFQARDCEIARLNTRIVNFEIKLGELAVELDTVETSLFDTTEDNYAKELELEKIKFLNDSLQNNVIKLKSDFECTHNLLTQALTEVEKQVSSNGEINVQVEKTLKRSYSEYLAWTTAVESYVEQKNSQILSLKAIMDRMVIKHESLVQEMYNEMGDLRGQLEIEKKSSLDLNAEVNRLYGELRKKSKTIREMEIRMNEDKKTNDVEVFTMFTDVEADQLKSQIRVYQEEMLNQLREYKALEDELERVKYSKTALKRFLKKNSNARKESETKLARIFHLMKRCRNRAIRSSKEVSALKKSAESASTENGILKQERGLLLQELYSLKEKLGQAEKLVKRHEEKRLAFEELKMKMEKMVLKLMKRVAKYKNALISRRDYEEAFRKEECTVISEKLSHEIDLLKDENMSLSTTICSLKQKLSSILELPQRDDVEEIVSEKSDLEKERALKENLKLHYENVIETMKNRYEAESEMAQKRYMENLRMVRETYDRETASFKANQCQQYATYKLELEEEIKASCRSENQIEVDQMKARLEEEFARDVAILTAKFEHAMEESEAKFENEKSQIEEKIMQVERELVAQRKESTEAVQSLKSDCENRILELKASQRELLDAFDSRVDIEVASRLDERQRQMESKAIQSQKVDSSDSTTETDAAFQKTDSSSNTDILPFVYRKVTDINLLERISCEIREESSKTLLSLVPSISDGYPSASERDFWLSRILELENNLRTQQSEFSRKLKLFEKKYKHEQLKAKEMAHILEQELMYSTDVHCKLGLQYNRAEQLELEKESLALQLIEAEQQLAFLRENMESGRGPMTVYDLNAPAKSVELKKSINRLRKKIEKAEVLERKLSDRNSALCAEKDFPIREMEVHNSAVDNQVSENGRHVSELKIIFVQQKRDIESWSSQVQEFYE